MIEQKQSRLDDVSSELEASRLAGRQLEDRLRQREEELTSQKAAHEAAVAELAKANNLNSQLGAVLKILESPNGTGNGGGGGNKESGAALERLMTEVTQCNNFISRLQDKVQALEADLERRDLEVEQLTAQLTVAQVVTDSGALSASDLTDASPSSGELPANGGLQWGGGEEELPGSLADLGKRTQDNDNNVKYQFLKRFVLHYCSESCRIQKYFSIIFIR